MKEPDWMRREREHAQRMALARADGFSPAALKRLAAAPINDSNRIFLPDGRLTADEAAERDRANVQDLSL